MRRVVDRREGDTMCEDLSDLDIASVESNSNAAQNDVCEELRIEKDDGENFRWGLPANGPNPETRIFAGSRFRPRSALLEY